MNEISELQRKGSLSFRITSKDNIFEAFTIDHCLFLQLCSVKNKKLNKDSSVPQKQSNIKRLRMIKDV